MSRVFCVQHQHRFDPQLGQLVPKYDLTTAHDFGEVEYLLSPSAAPFHPAGVLQELHTKLEDFCDADYLLLIGNPVLIGLAMAVAADRNDGRVKVLQWNGRERRYIPVKITGVFEDAPTEEDAL